MQTDNGSDTISFETLTPQMSAVFKQKSFAIDEQQRTEEADRVVKNASSLQTIQDEDKDQGNPKRTVRKRPVWSEDQQLEYFYAAIKFSLNNPYLTVSWRWWKPLRFYNFLQGHMRSKFGPDKGRTGNQIKTKDQNLRLKYFDKPSQSPQDILELSLYMLILFINDAKEEIKRQPIPCEKTVEQVERYQAILKDYKAFLIEANRQKEYELELKKLWDYSKQIFPKIKEVHGSL